MKRRKTYHKNESNNTKMVEKENGEVLRDMPVIASESEHIKRLQSSVPRRLHR
jgi:hypothetical protein